jgi:hypothetical protein
MKNFVICGGKSIWLKLNQNIIPVEFIDGVFVKRGEVHLAQQVKLPGNVGCMLAKLKAWDFVSQLEEPCNLFEEDEIIPPDYEEKRSRIIEEIGFDYDFVFLNVLRPVGEPHSENVLKISKHIHNREPVRNYCCNVWNSNYLVSPSFARILGKALRSHKKLWTVFHNSTSDWIISEILRDLSGDYKIFTVKKSNMISEHNEKLSIRRMMNKPSRA